MHPRDDESGGQRRHYRRLEDSHNANTAAQLASLARIVVKHEAWFQDLGVENMSLDQRQALPATMEQTLETRRERERWSRRTSALLAVAAAAGAIGAPFLEHLLGIHP